MSCELIKMKIIKPALVMIGFCLLWAAQAQSDNATKFADELAAFLRTEGYRATVNQDGYTVSFSYGGDSHIVKTEWEDPLYFVFINKAGYSLEGEAGFELNASILACNEVNREMESVKLYCGESRVMFNIEQYTRSFENFKSVLIENLDRLAEADERFVALYNELADDDSTDNLVKKINNAALQQFSGANKQELSLKGVNLLLIKGGTFTMGSPESEPGRNVNEVQHSVTLSDFYLSEKEVTNEQFCQFLNEKRVSKKGKGIVTGYGRKKLVKADKMGVQYIRGSWHPASGKATCPVVCVSWYGAKAYCDWAGGRLPTEAEWEYACRAGTTTAYSTGNNIIAMQANFSSRTGTVPAGSYPSNNWGLHDMHGNVFEWCNDRYGHYETYAVTNPAGPLRGSVFIIRGGGWRHGAGYCRSAYRFIYLGATFSNWIGFRIAKPL